MFRNDVVWRLAPLASLLYQERYIIGGTAKEYVLAEELIENVDQLRRLLELPANRASLTDVQLEGLGSFFSCLDDHVDAALSATSHIEMGPLLRESAAWKNIRAEASKALTLFGETISTMSVEEIDRLVED